MAKEYKTLMTEIRLPYELSYGPVWTRFFEGMAEKKLYVTKCEKCGRILVPALWKEERQGHILDIRYFEPV